MFRPMRNTRPSSASAIGWLIAAVVLSLGQLVSLSAGSATAPVTLVLDGAPQLNIVAGSAPEPVAELQRYARQISGAELSIVAAKPGAAGIYVGTTADFPWLKPTLAGAPRLAGEECLIRSDGTNLFLLGGNAAGVSHAVVGLLDSLGCRWFFPGAAWQVVPTRSTLRGAWNQVSRPSFPTQRKIWYGFGAYRPCDADYEAWCRHNRLGGSVAMSIGHTWHGLDADQDFAAHPDWFALVNGARKASKPCYSHPAVAQRAIESGLSQAARGASMISMTPPDGLGYCECERCFAVFQGARPEPRQGTWFATRPDGVVVSAASETLFRFINLVAAAVAAKYPGTLVGAYAYSAYSHPPSFALQPNVFLQTTTAFRRTDLTLEQQLDAFKTRVSQVGIRDYYSVYQWDWDYPSAGKLAPARLQQELQFFQRKGVTSVNAEASNNWGPRGLGYYLAARLLWDVNADVPALVREFYQQAFGPAAAPMERHYVRWYGSSASTRRPAPGSAEPVGHATEAIVLNEQDSAAQIPFSLAGLKASVQDLDEAAALVRSRPAERARVDQLRLYLHYLVLRARLDQAVRDGQPEAILAAIEAETVFGGRIAYSNMIHARPLLGKAFLRRFKPHQALLANIPAAQQEGAGWRQVGVVPTDTELDQLWATDKQFLGL